MVTSHQQGSIRGGAVKRVEDPRFIRGEGRYLDDLDIDAYAAVYVRSPVPHGVIESIDTGIARGMPGVIAIYTAADFDVDPVPRDVPMHECNDRPPLAVNKVRYAGEPIAIVVAETEDLAIDAAEMVWADIDMLPSVSGIEAALAADAPRLFDELESNVVWENGPVTPEESLRPADVVVEGVFVNQRLAAVPMETNNALAVPGEGVVELWLGSQSVNGAHDMTSVVLKMDKEEMRLRIPDMGGGFGAKIYTYPEQMLLVEVARRLNHPVRWLESRSENMTNMCHGRDQIQKVAIGATAEGDVLWIKGHILKNGGAYAMWGAYEPYLTQDMASGVYQIPQVALRVTSVVTNTVPNNAYRGAGRPEATAMVERLMNMLAQRLDMDPVELRRRNMITPDMFPYETSTGALYDSGDYQASLDRALEMAGYDELRSEQARRRAAGDRVQLGIGVSTYVEVTGLGGKDQTRVEIHNDGSATLTVGTMSHGQGHETTMRQILSEQLAIPPESIDFVQGDSAVVHGGGGTMASRSGQIGGSATVVAGAEVLDKARQIVADHLEAAAGDIVLSAEGTIGVAGSPESFMSWGEVAALAADLVDEDGETGLCAVGHFDQGAYTYPFGAHISVCEVDTETGDVTLLRHIAVDDCGYILNRVVVDGQVHGGVAIGIGQALYESVVYDDDANLLSGNLTSYLIPTAGSVPLIEIDHTQTPSPLNPLGMKGIGESGTIGSTPAVQNAVIDAVSHLGVTHIDMPLTPARVWQALHA